MTFDEFLNQYNGKGVDYDGYYGNQCVDLVQYWSHSIGGPRFWGDAKDIYSQAGTFFTQVPNTPTAVPQKGDIVVWSGNYNDGPGHIGIATGTGNTTTFECFEQNDPTGSNSHLKTYNYNYVLGWLHPKAIPSTDNITIPKKTFEELVGKATKYDDFVKAGFPLPDDVKKKIDDLNKQISDLQASGKYKDAVVSIKKIVDPL